MKVRFTAKDAGGKTVKGVVEAGTLKAAAAAVREQKMTPMSLAEIKPGFSLAAISNALGRISSSDVTNFTRQLATMITAGLPLTDALNLLKIQSPAPLAKVVGAVLTDVQGGVALSGSLAKHPKVFSKVYVALVKAGESAGLMEKILNRLADTAEKNREFRAKITGAMIYPIIILIGMAGVMVLMVVLVIPKMTELYKDFGSELPFATKALMWISDVSIHYWWAIIMLVIGMVFLVRYLIATESGRRGFDLGIFRVPVMGPLVKQTILTEFTRTMALLLSAGVSVVEALKIVSDSIGNVIVEKDVRRIANQVEKGFPVSISFTESEFFPPILGQMVAVGEETGKMDEVLQKISGYFESEAEQRVKGLTTAIEPIILMIMAVGVGFLMYAIIMPIYDITNKV
jgi:type II secretory pathway component PulF